ncbi:betaine-aldehyde dehydrogenase [Thiotrichales bacterium 19S3-7]|nr:betaine-aldehyde dehydrogenase [Thiotrichales bacterium 19S3-7]MCF6801023.1 betaine-aldehyde dehydrogenase [Thiotrichales bacterium 19S3-11]
MTNKIYQSFIHGKYIKSHSGDLHAVYNPATGNVNYHIEQADRKLFNHALESAKSGFLKWSKTPAVERGRILNKAAIMLREHNDYLASIEVEDTGKPFQEASSVDITTAADAIEFFAGLAASIEGNQQSLGDDFYYTRREPLGVCAGIGAWNYPIQIACWKAAPALACGNSMIFKPSEETPLGALKLAEILLEAGVPEGVFNVILGDKEIGQWLTQAPEIAKVSFTGEVTTGKKVMASSASSLKEITMELGGKSPLIIFEDADIELAVTAAMLGNFYTQGEICTNGTRVFVHQALYEEFISKLLLKIEKHIHIGDPKDPRTNFGALISKAHLDKVLRYIESGISQGATLLCGGKQIQPLNCDGGYFISPTVFVDCHDAMHIVKEEIFGPVMTVLTFNDEDDVIKRANDTNFGLAAGVFSSNISKAHRVAHQLQAGICWINTYGLSPVEMPVGGYKESGIGRENGLVTLHQYTQLKSVYVGLSPLASPYDANEIN